MKIKSYYMPDVGEKYISTAKNSVYKYHVIRIDYVFGNGIGCKGRDLTIDSPVSFCDGMDTEHFLFVMN